MQKSYSVFQPLNCGLFVKQISHMGSEELWNNFQIILTAYGTLYSAFLSFWSPKGLVAILFNCMEMVAKRFSLCSIEKMNDMSVCKWWQKFHFQVNCSFKGVRESDLKTCQAVLCCGEERSESREMRGCHTHFTQKQLVVVYLLTIPMKHSLSLASSHLFLSVSVIHPSAHSVPQD